MTTFEMIETCFRFVLFLEATNYLMSVDIIFTKKKKQSRWTKR